MRFPCACRLPDLTKRPGVWGPLLARALTRAPTHGFASRPLSGAFHMLKATCFIAGACGGMEVGRRAASMEACKDAGPPECARCPAGAMRSGVKRESRHLLLPCPLQILLQQRHGAAPALCRLHSERKLWVAQVRSDAFAAAGVTAAARVEVRPLAMAQLVMSLALGVVALAADGETKDYQPACAQGDGHGTKVHTNRAQRKIVSDVCITKAGPPAKASHPSTSDAQTITRTFR